MYEQLSQVQALAYDQMKKMGVQNLNIGSLRQAFQRADKDFRGTLSEPQVW